MNKEKVLPDIPLAHDKSILLGAHLAKEGRTPPVELREALHVAPALHHRLTVPNLGLVYVLRKTLYKETWKRPAAGQPTELH